MTHRTEHRPVRAAEECPSITGEAVLVVSHPNAETMPPRSSTPALAARALRTGPSQTRRQSVWRRSPRLLLPGGDVVDDIAHRLQLPGCCLRDIDIKAALQLPSDIPSSCSSSTASVSATGARRTYTYDALGRMTKQVEPVTATDWLIPNHVCQGPRERGEGWELMPALVPAGVRS